jgi:hypothetical protein
VDGGSPTCECLDELEIASLLSQPVLITDKMLEPSFATYTFVPSGVKATIAGLVNPLIRAVTWPVATLITDTNLESRFATYAVLPLGLIATEIGVEPTLIDLVTVFVATIPSVAAYSPARRHKNYAIITKM